MESCQQQLQNNVGCFVLDLFYFKLRQLEAGEGNVIETKRGFAGLIELWYNIHLYIKELLFILN
jgi:hypothetical protein